jgi:diadenosine tetraphosphate (Ap4A) HIT family hydrolase
VSCPLCCGDGETVLWRDDLCHVIHAHEPDHPGFLRVILNAHVKEMTDLPLRDREGMMRVVFAAESALRETMAPDKINLASLGNVVPHLHWHVIPRFADDPHFPNPVWGEKKRQVPHTVAADIDAALARALERLLSARQPG